MNPIDRFCFRLCRSCYRCADKGTRDQCGSCSGRNDPQEKHDPHDVDDYCRCAEGVMQYRTSKGNLLQIRFPRDPFKGEIKREGQTEDERDWESYLNEQRERFDDEHWDPVQFYDDSSASDWYQGYRRGK